MIPKKTTMRISVLCVVMLFAHQEGYAMGRDAARIKNPAIQYVESGVMFCFDHRTIITSGTTGAGLSGSRDGRDNL